MAPATEVQLLAIVTRMSEQLDAHREELQRMRVEVTRLVTLGEARDRQCDMRHDEMGRRLLRHSEGIVSLRRADEQAREAHVSQLEDDLAEVTQTGLRPAGDAVSVARWQAIAAIGAAALAGGVLSSVARVVVTALAHAMGIGG